MDNEQPRHIRSEDDETIDRNSTNDHLYVTHSDFESGYDAPDLAAELLAADEGKTLSWWEVEAEESIQKTDDPDRPHCLRLGVHQLEFYEGELDEYAGIELHGQYDRDEDHLHVQEYKRVEDTDEQWPDSYL